MHSKFKLDLKVARSERRPSPDPATLIWLILSQTNTASSVDDSVAAKVPLRVLQIAIDVWRSEGMRFERDEGVVCIVCAEGASSERTQKSQQNQSPPSGQLWRTCMDGHGGGDG